MNLPAVGIVYFVSGKGPYRPSVTGVIVSSAGGGASESRSGKSEGRAQSPKGEIRQAEGEVHADASGP